jgi:phosphoglycolate phosphatase
MMDHLGLKNHFDLIVGADDVEHPKPHPQMLERHLRHHRYDHGTDRAWMVGDNAKDMEAATAAGITSIFAGWGFSPHGSGEWNARTPAELIEIICTGG